jgi:hypothetical protein
MRHDAPRMRHDAAHARHAARQAVAEPENIG